MPGTVQDTKDTKINKASEFTPNAAGGDKRHEELSRLRRVMMGGLLYTGVSIEGNEEGAIRPSENKSIPGSGHSKCKGPGVGLGYACFSNTREVSVAQAE